MSPQSKWFTVIAFSVALSSASASQPPKELSSIPRIDLYFEPNLGQISEPGTSFLARGSEVLAQFRERETVLHVSRQLKSPKEGIESVPLRMRFTGSRPVRYEPVDEMDGVSAYYGKDSSKWLPRVPHYARIAARGIYKGIDVVYYGNGTQLEYDFVVAPGGNPNEIEIAYDDAQSIRTDEEGELEIQTAAGEIRQKRAVVYQTLDGGKRVDISANYLVRGNRVKFALGRYDRKRPLVIDPVLEYATLLPGDNSASGMAVDPAGNVYLIGRALSIPIENPISPFGGGRPFRRDTFVSKLVFNPVTKSLTLAYSTFIPDGGAAAISVDSTGNAYVAGNFSGSEFPTLNTPYTFGPAFVCKIGFNATTRQTQLLYSTKLPAAGLFINGLDIDASGSAYVTGTFTAYPGDNLQPLQLANLAGGTGPFGGNDAFVLKLSFATGQNAAIAWTAFIGGAGADAGRRIKVDTGGGILVAGETAPGSSGASFPLLWPLAQFGSAPRGAIDVFLTKLVQSGSGAPAMQFSTLFGSNFDDNVSELAVDRTGGIALSLTAEGSTMPVVNGLPNASAGAFFVSMLSFDTAQNRLSLLYSTRLPSVQAAPALNAIAFDNNGDLWVTGPGDTPPTESLYAPGSAVPLPGDNVVARLSFRNGTLSLPYVTKAVIAHPVRFMGIDGSNNVYIAGESFRFSADALPQVNPLTVNPTGTASVAYVLRISASGGGPAPQLLTLTKTGNARVTATGSLSGSLDCGLNCAGLIGGTATISVTPDPEFQFLHWTDACAGQNNLAGGGPTTCTLNMDSPKTVGAFLVRNRLITIQKTGTGTGIVTGNAGIDCGATCSVRTTYYVFLTAVPAPGSKFVRWTGGCSGTDITCTINDTSLDQTVTAVFDTATTQPASHFFPLEPCRLVDTRISQGAFGSPALNTQEVRSYAIPGRCGVAAGATAYALNITVVPKGPLSYLTVFPAGYPLPTVSTLNSLDARIKGSSAIVAAGNGGGVSFYATNPTELIVDVTGYFADPGASNAGMQFYSLPPCRLADTRDPPGQFGAPSMNAVETRQFSPQLSVCTVPAVANSYSLNLTVVPKRPLSYVSLFPSHAPLPNTSVLNALLGQIVANAAIIQAGATDKALKVYTTEPTEIILDINGYFAPAGSANGLKFYPVTPCRVSDTRSPTGTFGGPIMNALESRTYPIPSSACGIPASARAYSLSATVVPPSTGLGYLTLYPDGQPLPTVSTLNALDGSITSNAAIVPAGTGGAIRAFVSQSTHLILDINGYFAP